MGVLDLFSGYKTYLAAAGFVGLAVYQVSEGQFELAVQSFMQALTALGLRHAIAKQAGPAEVGP